MRQKGRAKMENGRWGVSRSPISEPPSPRVAMISVQWDPSRKQLRQFAGIWFPAFCGMLGWVIGKKTGQWTAVEVGWWIGGLLAVAGFVWPPLIRPVFVGLILATFPIGWVVSHVLLGLIYYGIVTPLGMILRMSGHDPLQLKPPREKSLWKSQVGKTDPSSYLRQS